MRRYRMAPVAKAPNGRSIVGTLERLAGRANTVDGSFERDENGKLAFEYEGCTEIFWDEQKTVRKHGAPVFLDEDGFQWEETEILLSQE
jgi:hypothetical protein